MKKMLKSIFFLLLAFNMSFAFAGTVDHFQVEFSKNTAMQFESLDITIKAVDKNNEIVEDYTGSILSISETDDDIELPQDLASDDGYTFKLSDQGVKKFENGIKFSTMGEQKISVYDIEDYQNLVGNGKVTIIEAKQVKKDIEIEIITPETNTTIAVNKVKVSGATKKNHQVKIEINGEKNITTTSNSDGIFEKEIIDLKSGENFFKAFVLDADENVIGTSNKVVIKVNDNKPIFKKIILSPLSESGSVEELTNVDVKVFATKKLKTVNLLFNDGIIPLSETENGIYTGNFKTPKGKKTYILDVVLINDMGNTTTEKEVAVINVFDVKVEKPKIEPVTCEGVKKSELKITGLKLVKLKSKSILTWKKLDKAESYDIYKKSNSGEFEFLKNVKTSKFEINITGKEIKHQFFAVKAKAKGCENEVIIGDLSKATKIQTGPAEIILMLLLALIIGFGFKLINKKKI